MADAMGLALIVLHGSAMRNAATAHDSDIAYLPATGVDADPFDTAEAFALIVLDDHLDLMPLHSADPVGGDRKIGGDGSVTSG